MLEQALAFSPGADKTDYRAWASSVRAMNTRMDPEARTAGPIPHFGKLIGKSALTAQGEPTPFSATQTPDNINQSPEEEFGFLDILDIINPLQHIPVLSTFYQRWTGDTIKPACQIAGGALFGGPIGAMGSAVNAMIKEGSGKDITENAFSLAGVDLAPESARPTAPTLVYESASKADAQSFAKGAAAYQAPRNFAGQTTYQSWNA